MDGDSLKDKKDGGRLKGKVDGAGGSHQVKVAINMVAAKIMGINPIKAFGVYLNPTITTIVLTKTSWISFLGATNYKATSGSKNKTINKIFHSWVYK